MRCWNAEPVCSPMSNPAAVSISIYCVGRWFFGPTHPMTAIAYRQSPAAAARHSLPNDCRTFRRIWSGATIPDCNRPPRRLAGGRGGSTTVAPGSPAGRAPHEAVYLYDQVEAAAGRFRQVVDAASKLVSDLTEIELLNGPDGGRFLSELVNRPGLPWDGSVSSGMNWSLAVSELDAERRFLRLDGEPVILYSLLSPPGAARANMLNDLYRLNARMTVSLEWRPYTTEAGRKKINSARKHYFSQRYSMMAHVQETEGSATAMEDSVASAESDRLSKALVELETDGIAYGDVSLSIALHGELAEIERLDGDLRRIFATHDAKLIQEGYGQLAQWFNRMPGQPRSRQLRKVLVSAGAAASLAPLFGPPRGTEQSAHLGAPALTTLETHWQTPFFYDLFAGDVGHTLILGATGAGKSFTLNFLLVQALQYQPRVLILDLGGSYRWLTTFPRRGLPGTVAR